MKTVEVVDVGKAINELLNAYPQSDAMAALQIRLIEFKAKLDRRVRSEKEGEHVAIS